MSHKKGNKIMSHKKGNKINESQDRMNKGFLKKSIKDKCMLSSLKKSTSHAISMHQSILQIHSCSLTSNRSSFKTNLKMCNKSRSIYGQSVKHTAKQEQV